MQGLYARRTDEIVRETVAHLEEAIDATRILEQTPSEIASQRGALNCLRWMARQPLSAQVLPDLKMAFAHVVWFCLLAAVAVNLGWMPRLGMRVMARGFRRLFWATRPAAA